MMIETKTRMITALACGLMLSDAITGPVNVSAQDTPSPPRITEQRLQRTPAQGDQQKSARSAQGKDAKFIREAAEGGMKEVQLGQIAAQKASDPQVKQLAQRLEQDHTKANQQLRQLAQTVGVQIPERIDSKGSEEMEKLQSKSGTEFDRAFVEHAIKHHRKDIREFERASKDAENPQVISFIQQTLPVLKEHLQMAQSAGRTLGVNESLLSDRDPDQDSDAVGGSTGTTTGTGSSDEKHQDKKKSPDQKQDPNP